LPEAITPTKISGPQVAAGAFQAEYTLLMDTTSASGLQTIDLTNDFGYVNSIEIGGSLAATGYVCKIQKPAPTIALTATNVKLGIYQDSVTAGDKALVPVASTDVSAVITGMTIVVRGKKAVPTSWA